MMERLLFPQHPLTPTVNQVRKPTSPPERSAFGQILNQELTGIKFSQHAKDRLQTRNIQLGQAELTKLNSAVEKAAQKGSRESLVLMDNLALVVSIKNRTVITALDGANIKDNVFTNIDSAVII